jgi:ribokinase
MSGAGVVVVGSLNMDIVVRTPRLPSPGETLLGDAVAYVPGGKGLNQAVAAARLGAPTTMIGCVGRDPYGDQLTDVAAGEGIDVSTITAVDTPTGTAHIAVDHRGANTIIVVPGANSTMVDLEPFAANIAQAAVVLVQLEIPLAVALAALRLGKAGGATTILNPAPAVPVGLLHDVDLVVPNETEAALITSHDEAEAAAKELLATGAQTAVITLGDAGALVADSTGVRRLAPYTVQAVDTTAAGDAFCGALAASLALGDDLATALDLAMACGALATTRHGAVPSLPRRAEVDALRR